MSPRRPALGTLLLVVLSATACEPPLTEARRSLAIRTVFRDLTTPAAPGTSGSATPGACLRTRYLAPADSALPPLLRTALRQRRVPLTDADAPPDTAMVMVAVSPIRELDDVLGLDAALGRSGLEDGRLRTEWTEWTYRLRCGVRECEIERRLGPRPSRLDTLPSADRDPGRRAGPPCPAQPDRRRPRGGPG